MSGYEAIWIGVSSGQKTKTAPLTILQWGGVVKSYRIATLFDTAHEFGDWLGNNGNNNANAGTNTEHNEKYLRCR